MKRDKYMIQMYLDHDLSEKEMKRFEADLETSPELQAELVLYREVDEALADTEVLNFRDQLRDLRKETKQSSGNSRLPIRFTKPWHYAATAAIALILAIGMASFLDRPISNKDLLKKYYKPYEVALINRSNDTELELMLQHAERLYLDGEFAEAVVYFEKVLEQHPDQVATNLYTGISYFEMNRYTDAGISFNKVIEHNDNLYVEQAEWYLGLCYLATNDTERARRQFARIASSNSDKKRAARKLLRKLKN
ncbi:MAG: tetratricopeptide repeat protein [Bacteroidales bacterium]|nr:tetratricopeptide repeat protein [Bacteroidales bacterium]